MDKPLQNKLKRQLEAEKDRLTAELKRFARKDKKIKGNWLTRFPFFGASRSHPDETAEEVEQYENLLPVERELEGRLKSVEEALEKIKHGTYGQCDVCKKAIESDRLKAVPEAKTCLKCGR